MRKLTVSALCFLLFISCQKNTSSPETPEASAQQILKRTCASQEVLEAQMAANPSLRDKMRQIEDFTQRKIASGEALRINAKNEIEIPVVVHVLYNKPEENISDAQIQSQLDVLNEDYNLRNPDNRLVPSLFSDRKADVGVKFVLAQTIRKATTKQSWPPNDAMKYTSRGGSDAVDASRYLNMWSCNLGQNLLGYAQFPGGDPATDGVVILYSAFGRTGTLIQKYNLGRTATHEVGHWMNLRHIWGDTNCGNDYVDDTPLHTTANYGCPDYPFYNSCSDHAVEMTMNYMDYTDDACMYMFSNGQKARMLAVFAAGGPRAGFH
jgi:hypothetical protein